jgi:hypothetical protein
LSETGIKIKDINEEDNLDQIWKKMDMNVSATLPFIE